MAAIQWPSGQTPEVTQGAKPSLDAFLREYFFILLYQGCAESLAGENASRLAAMQRVEKNLEDMLADNNRRFHRIRQDSSGEELLEVIAGIDFLVRE